MGTFSHIESATVNDKTRTKAGLPAPLAETRGHPEAGSSSGPHYSILRSGRKLRLLFAD